MLEKIMHEWMMVSLGVLSILLLVGSIAAVAVAIKPIYGAIVFLILLLGTPFIYYLIKKIREKK